MELIREFAGRERRFVLRLGDIMDIEQACGDGKDSAPVGVIFQRLSTGRFSVKDVVHTLRFALVGGGMEPIKALSLVRDRVEGGSGLLRDGEIALQLLMMVMAGVEDAGPSDNAEPKPLRLSDLSLICQTFGMTPEDLRATRYADFVNLIRGFNAAGKGRIEPISEDEFAELLAKYEPEA